jgi:hypothetical protein
LFKKLSVGDKDFVDRALIEYTAASFHFEQAGTFDIKLLFRTTSVLFSSHSEGSPRHMNIWGVPEACLSK